MMQRHYVRKEERIGAVIVLLFCSFFWLFIGLGINKALASDAPSITIRDNIELIIGSIEPIDGVQVVLRKDSQELAATRVGANYGHYRVEYAGIRCADIKSIKIRLSAGDEWQNKIAVCYEIASSPEP